MSLKICICGIGYVGLTLAIIMAEKGYDVTGIDQDPRVIDRLYHGKPHFFETGLPEKLQLHLNRGLRFLESIPTESFDAYIITVGTPLRSGQKTPDLTSLENATISVAEKLRDGDTVILRSTVPLGITRNFVLPILQRKVQNVRLAFCPERTVEGKALEELQTLPQIIGGLNTDSTAMAIHVFRKITPHIVPVSTLETAEMIKLVDNAYRDVSFAFANQIGELCTKAKIDAGEVIKAANTDYPRNRVPLPGFVGGACLEKDPHILVFSASSLGYSPLLIRSARELNESLPQTVAGRIRDLLTGYGIVPKIAKVFLTGIAFKGNPETDDLRGSPSLSLLEAMNQVGLRNIFVHDFVANKEKLMNIGLKPTTLEKGFAEADVVVIGNNHPSYHSLNIGDLLSTTHKPVIIFDSWRMIDPTSIIGINSVHYEGLGLQSELLEEYRYG